MIRVELTLALLLVVGTFSSATPLQDRQEQIPFRFEHNEIIVSATIQGQGPCPMLLDTDTNPSVISLAVAQQRGLKLRKIGEARYLTTLPAVALAGTRPKDLQALAINLREISDRLGTEIQGVLGHDFLSGRVLQIDYAHNMLRVAGTSASSARVVATLPYRYDDDSSSLVVDGVLVNGKRVMATIDTGSDGTFKLTPKAVDLLGLTEAARTGGSESSVGYSGVAQNTVGQVDEIVIGDIRVPTPHVVFFGRGTGRDRKPWGINIGNEFLREYVVTVDDRRKLILLQKPSG